MVSYLQNQCILKVQNINKSYGDKKILENINFNIFDIQRDGVENQGQIISLLGKSGCGKTTLLKIIAQLEKPTAGEILINSFNETNDFHSVQEGEIGVVFQNFILFSHRTVFKNLELACRNKPLKERKELIHEYADKFELSQHLNKYPFELSGGQKQRTSIVQQLLVGNKIILLDEPFSGLDCHMIDKVKNSLLKVSLENSLNTLIIVSHDLENSISISDRAIILSNKNNTAASIVQDFNLIDMGIAYQDNVKYLSQFQDLIKTIKENL